jgi:hypothetical protein
VISPSSGEVGSTRQGKSKEQSEIKISDQVQKNREED